MQANKLAEFSEGLQGVDSAAVTAGLVTRLTAILLESGGNSNTARSSSRYATGKTANCGRNPAFLRDYWQIDEVEYVAAVVSVKRQFCVKNYAVKRIVEEAVQCSS